MEPKLITLTTDYGTKDPFVGIIKGVIFGINPDCRVIDLSHGVPPQDLLAGALVLSSSVPYFPWGTIHVAVVDPGVGTNRRPLLIESEGHFFIGPDNGVLSLALEGKHVGRIIELSNGIYHLKPTSATFHGRDIFAPVAAYLSLGIPAEDFGAAVKDFTRLLWPRVAKTGLSVQGEIVYIDSFGNLITNIHERDLGGRIPTGMSISVGSLTIDGLAPNYASGDGRGYAALINSWGLLEVSFYKGNAHLNSGAKLGDKVHIRPAQATP